MGSIVILLLSGQFLYGYLSNGETVDIPIETNSTGGYPINTPYDGPLLIGLNIELNNLLIAISEVNFAVTADKISIEDGNSIEIKSQSLNIEGFSGTLEMKDSYIVLDGSFLKLYNREIQFETRNDIKIIIYGGTLTSKKLIFSKIKARASGNISINTDQLEMSFYGKELDITGFDGKFGLSVSPDRMELNGYSKGVYIDNYLFKVDIR